MLEKMVNFVYGALIFLILVGIAFAVYHIFWADSPSVAEQNFDSVFAELNVLKKGSCFDVVIRPSKIKHALFLYQWKNSIEGCAGRPCLCLDEEGSALSCRILPDAVEDCSKGLCVPVMSSAAVYDGDKIAAKSIKICNSNNKLSVSV